MGVALTGNFKKVQNMTINNLKKKILEFFGDGYLYSGDSNGEVHRIKRNDLSSPGKFTGHDDSVLALTFGTDYNVYSGQYKSSNPSNIYQIKTDSMSNINSFSNHTGTSVESMITGPEGYVYVGIKDEGIVKINPSDMSAAGSITIGASSIYSVIFGPDGYFYAGGDNKEVHRINPVDFSLAGKYSGSANINSIFFDMEGFLHAAIGTEVHKVDKSNMSLKDKYTNTNGSTVNSLMIGLGGYLYAAVGNNVHKFNPNGMDKAGEFTNHNSKVNALMIGPDGFLFSASDDNTIRKINPDSMSEYGSYTGHSGSVKSLTLR